MYHVYNGIIDNQEVSHGEIIFVEERICVLLCNHLHGAFECHVPDLQFNMQVGHNHKGVFQVHIGHVCCS